MRLFSYQEEWTELLHTLASNKLRTVLTGFAVGWGILILVLLLSSGKGFQNGVMENMTRTGMSEASINLYINNTSMPYKGVPSGYSPALYLSDLEAMERDLGHWVERAVPHPQLGMMAVSYQERSASGLLQATTGAYAQVRHIPLQGKGARFINDADQQSARKVLVIGSQVCQGLFSSADEALGKVVLVDGIAFTVVGVHDIETSRTQIYIPLSTQQRLGLGRSSGDRLFSALLLVPGVQTEEDEKVFKDELTRYLANRKGFSPEDMGVVGLWSRASMLGTTNQIFTAIDTFLWILGISTLVIGVIGVINIMQIVVSERKREIGIRKALGARPADVVRMILLESVFVTTISGLCGMVVGVWLMRLVGYLMDVMSVGSFSFGDGDGDVKLFIDPMIDLPNAVGAVVVMILGGVLAGYLPARRAVRLSAVEAMRH